MDNNRLLGNRIRIARKDRGLTGEALSELCNVNATYLRQIESGAKMPSLPLFIELCRQMKISPSYLLADVLADSDIQEMESIDALMQRATPRQLKLISAMLEGALRAIDGEE